MGQVNDRNERHGYGKYFVVYGGMYDGYWMNGYKHGQGKFYNRQGVLVYDGLWEAGEPHGPGKLYNSSGQLVYQGFMNRGKTSSGLNWMSVK